MSVNDNNTDGVSKNFNHPYEPYDIQQRLMKVVYDCIEDGKIGIFESPTGELENNPLLTLWEA